MTARLACGIAVLLLCVGSAGFTSPRVGPGTPLLPDTLVVRSFGVELRYDVQEIHAKAGDTLTIRYDNSASEMTHNFVLVGSEEDVQPVGTAALEAHGNDYIPESEMHRILAYSPLVYPGEIAEFSFVVPPPGSYPYICTFSGHFTMMQGRLISTE